MPHEEVPSMRGCVPYGLLHYSLDSGADKPRRCPHESAILGKLEKRGKKIQIELRKQCSSWWWWWWLSRCTRFLCFMVSWISNRRFPASKKPLQHIPNSEEEKNNSWTEFIGSWRLIERGLCGGGDRRRQVVVDCGRRHYDIKSKLSRRNLPKFLF